MSNHTMLAECEVKFRPVSLEDFETAYPKIEIEFSYLPGYPAQGPSYYSGGEPAAGAEVGFISATMVDPGDLYDATQSQIDDMARDYLDSDHGYNQACRVAEGEQGPDPDAAYDRMRDDRDA